MLEAIGTALSTKIADTIKDPKKLMFILFFISAFFIFSPDLILGYLGVMRQQTAPVSAIVFLFTLAYFIYDGVSWTISKNNDRIKKKQELKVNKEKRSELIKYFNSLDDKERNIIKRYHKFNRSVIGLRLDMEAVFDFINRELICKVEELEEETEVGTYYYFKLNDLVREYVLNVFQEEALRELKTSQQ